MNRKVLLAGIGLLLSLGVVISGCGSESDFASSGGSFQNAQAGPVPSVSSTPQSALDELKAGNARYVAGTNQQLFRTSDRPLILNSTQAPIAMILSCADSRVTPELAFDQAWGQLFVVRVAGPVADQNGVGSFEFGHTVLGSKLLVVLGHEQCGAVNAALGQQLPAGNLGALVQLIVPAAESVKGQSGDPQDNAVRANVKLQIERIRGLSSVLDQAIRGGSLAVQGAVYHFDTGEVEFLTL